MVRIARERISDLFALAESEASGRHPELADRYVQLARRIGMRYNVRLLPEYRELYCRGCSKYWVEGRTVRTRLRQGHRVRTCLACGRVRLVRTRSPGPQRAQKDLVTRYPATRDGAVLAEAPSEEEAGDLSDEETEEP